MKQIWKKTLLILGLITVCMALVTGCKQEEREDGNQSAEPTSQNAEATVDMKQLKEAMLAADTTLPEMSVVYGSDENGPDLFCYLADYDYENVVDYFFAYAAEGTAEEIAVIRLRDRESATDCVEAVREHVESRMIQFKTYDPSQVERCEAAVIFSNECYVVLIICDSDKTVKEAFYSAFR